MTWPREPAPPPGRPSPPAHRGSRLRRAARAARHAPDRVLHARRRAAALARLRARAVPRSVLFICHGNIIRSPFAERLAATALPPALRGRVDLGSAGFVGPGRPSPRAAVEAAARWGVDLSAHRSRRVTVEDLRRAELVVVVEPRQLRPLLRLGCPAAKLLVLGDLDPAPIDTRSIPDPFDRTESVFIESYRRIHRCLHALLGAVSTEARP